MKFSCERCNTRYSIADERVRGKILKIRCKTCATVISVREGMDDGSGAVSSAALAVPSSATIQLAAVAPPPSLHEEWYVSIDGHQEGPFGLAHAQAWVAARPAADELFCWSEGFDDWLPVEKVSHFRGLRAPQAAPVRTPPVAESKPAAAAAAKPAAAARPALGGLRPLPRPGEGSGLKPLPKPGEGSGLKPLPKPGAKAEDAKQAAEAKAAEDAKQAAEAKAAEDAKQAAEAKAAEDAKQAAAAKAAEDAKQAAEAKAAHDAKAVEDAKAAEDATRADAKAAEDAKKADAKAAEDAKKAEGAKKVDAKKAAEDAKKADAKKATGDAKKKADDAKKAPPLPSKPAKPAAEPAAASSGSIAPVAAAIAAAGASSTGPIAPASTTPAASAPSAARPNGAAPAKTETHDDDDLSIGEVSRVLRIADLGLKKPRKANPPIPSAPATDPVRALENPSSSTALPVADVGPSSTRRPVVLYLLLAVLAIGAIVAIVFVATQDGADEKLGPVRSGSTDYTNLGRRIDDPIGSGTGSVATPGTGSGSAPGTAGGSVRRPGTGGGSVRTPSGSGTGTGAGTGSTGSGSAAVDTNPAATPLTPDDVVSMSQKMSTGTRRCYDHALKGDPFLKIDKVVATIAVGASGKVDNVSLSKMAGTPFGVCLEATIRRWRFRPSTEGIVSDISMIFGKG